MLAFSGLGWIIHDIMTEEREQRPNKTMVISSN